MFDGSFIRWNQIKVKTIVNHYSHNFFYKKRILDLGCGYGDVGGVLYRLGCDLTVVDARQEHLKIVDKKFPGVKIIKADLDQTWPFIGSTFELILDLGLICHLKNFEEHLKFVCASAKHLVLETAVIDSLDPNLSVVQNDSKHYEGSFNGYNSQISVANIERMLNEFGMSFKRMDQAKFNSSPYIYDWKPQNNNVYNHHKRRIWFCTKNHTQSIVIPNAVHIDTNNTSNNSNNSLVNSGLPIVSQVIQNNSISQSSQSVQPTFTPIVKSSSGKMRLFYNYYIDKNPQRKQEIDFCLQKNLDNAFFDLIIIESKDNPTFNFMFDKINRLSSNNDINIICNADIFFDNTVVSLKSIKDKDVYALSRWNWKVNTHQELDEKNQDAWVIKGKINNVNGNFQMGKPGCDGRIAYEFKLAGYNVINPSKSVKIFHHHTSNIRNHNENDKITGEYLYTQATTL